jgi:hypothetical protein
MSAWVDIFAPPASGKSTICDPLSNSRGIESKWNGAGYPNGWRVFLETIPPLLELIKDHKRPVPTRNGNITSFQAMTGMLGRNLRKMTVVSQMQGTPYIGTAFAMRGVGIGWRLLDMGRDPRLVRSYFWTMPVSIGFAYLKCSPETLKARNRARQDVPETSWEDRSFQIDLQLPVIEILKEVLIERGVSFLELDTENQPANDARAQLLDFAHQGADHTEAGGFGSQGSTFQASA